MDSLTHIVLGAGIQTAILGKVQKRKALLYGAVLATLPDLDVLSRYADPLSSMTYHRGATHSLLYLSVFALVLTYLICRFRPNPHYSGMRLLLALTLVLLTHPLLDALTVYGTQIFYPWMPPPASFPALFIIDPLFTLPLLILFVAVLWRGISGYTIRNAQWVLLWCVLYLAFGIAARITAEQRVKEALSAQGMTVVQLKGVPLPLNNIVWRVLARNADGTYCEGVSSLFDRRLPETLCMDIHPELAVAAEGNPLYHRLNWFTDGWVRYDIAGNELVVSDLRMGTADKLYFRFVTAKRGADGTWQAVVPYRFSDDSTHSNIRLDLLRVWRRIWTQPPLFFDEEGT